MAFVVEKKKESLGARSVSPRPRRIAIELDADDENDEKQEKKKLPKARFKAKRGPATRHVESLEDSEKSVESLAKRHRQAESSLKGRLEKELSERERRGPPTSELKTSPEALKLAARRGQIKMIAKRASPESKDTDNVFTGEDGARYARTDLYSPTIADRLSAAKRRAKTSSSDWWQRNKGKIVLGSLAAAALYLLYSTGKAARDRSRLVAMQRALPVAHPSAAHKTGHWASIDPTMWAIPWASPEDYERALVPHGFLPEAPLENEGWGRSAHPWENHAWGWPGSNAWFTPEETVMEWW